MNRYCLDARVWLPGLLAALAFAPRALPPSPPSAIVAAPAITLPPLHGSPPASTAQDYELDAAACSVRFLVEGSRGELLARCRNVTGSLRLGVDGTGSLELHLDLGSLEPLGERSDIDLHRLLGVHRHDISYRAELLSTTTSNLPGMTRLAWSGTMRVGSCVLRQGMELWQCRLPGRPLRFQGQGTVEAASLGLPQRRWYGILKENYDVTLGLQLVWRRQRAH